MWNIRPLSHKESLPLRPIRSTRINLYVIYQYYFRKLGHPNCESTGTNQYSMEKIDGSPIKLEQQTPFLCQTTHAVLPSPAEPCELCKMSNRRYSNSSIKTSPVAVISLPIKRYKFCIVADYIISGVRPNHNNGKQQFPATFAKTISIADPIGDPIKSGNSQSQ